MCSRSKSTCKKNRYSFGSPVRIRVPDRVVPREWYKWQFAALNKLFSKCDVPYVPLCTTRGILSSGFAGILSEKGGNSASSAGFPPLSVVRRGRGSAPVPRAPSPAAAPDVCRWQAWGKTPSCGRKRSKGMAWGAGSPGKRALFLCLQIFVL